MPAPTVAEVRARVSTDITDAALQALIDSEWQAVERAAGKEASRTRTFAALGAREIVLDAPAQSVTSVSEQAKGPESDPVALAAGDYRLRAGRYLDRLDSGPNPASWWGARVEVAYVPEVDANVRKRVTIDLVQLRVDFGAYDTESTEGWKGSRKDYRARRRAILREVNESRTPIA